MAAHLPTDEVSLADETRHEWRLRFVVKVVGRVPLFQAAFLEDTDLVTDRKGFFLVVSDQNGAGTAAFENVANLMAQATAQLYVEVRERLVKQQQLRLGRQRPGQGDTLLLATRQLMRVTTAQPAEFDQFQHLFDDGGLAWVFGDTKGNVLRHGKMREQRVVLKHHADAALFRGQGEASPGNDLTAQVDFTFVHRLETGDGAQGGGLAATG